MDTSHQLSSDVENSCSLQPSEGKSQESMNEINNEPPNINQKQKRDENDKICFLVSDFYLLALRRKEQSGKYCPLGASHACFAH